MGVFILASADPITDAINTNAQAPQSMSGDGVSRTNVSLNDLIEAKKFTDANAALSGIANGTAWFPRAKINSPGAGGYQHDDC